MNYQQTKTIQKYNINKNLLLVGLFAFAALGQGCTLATKKGVTKGGDNAPAPDAVPMLELIGKFGKMDLATFKAKVASDANKNSKSGKVDLASGKIVVTKLPPKTEVIDEQTQKSQKVPYFVALKSELVKEGKKEKLVENKEITGLYKTALDAFSEDKGDKNAKIFVIAKLLEFQEAVKAAQSKEDIEKATGTLSSEIAKVKKGGCGVLVKVDAQGNLEFVDLTAADKKLSKKYTLSEGLSDFVEQQIIKSAEGKAKEVK